MSIVCWLNVYVLWRLRLMLVTKQTLRADGTYTRPRFALEYVRPCDSRLYRRGA